MHVCMMYKMSLFAIELLMWNVVHDIATRADAKYRTEGASCKRGEE